MLRLSRFHAAVLGVLLAAFALSSCVALPTDFYNNNHELRKKAKRYPLERYVPELLNAAETNFKVGTNFYSNNNSKSLKALTLSFENYEKALAVGLPLYFKDKDSESVSNKKEADDLKASVCVQDRYRRAQSNYEAATRALKAAREGITNTNVAQTARGPVALDFYMPSGKKASKKDLDALAKERRARRELLVGAVSNMEAAEAEFKAAKVEAKEKKDRSDAALEGALGDMNAVEQRGKTILPKRKEPGPTPDADR